MSNAEKPQPLTPSGLYRHVAVQIASAWERGKDALVDEIAIALGEVRKEALAERETVATDLTEPIRTALSSLQVDSPRLANPAFDALYEVEWRMRQAKDERREIVRWLRAQAPRWIDSDLVVKLADSVASGEHKREALNKTSEAEESNPPKAGAAPSGVGPDRKLDEQGDPKREMPGTPVPADQPSPPAEAPKSRGATTADRTANSMFNGEIDWDAKAQIVLDCIAGDPNALAVMKKSLQWAFHEGRRKSERPSPSVHHTARMSALDWWNVRYGKDPDPDDGAWVSLLAAFELAAHDEHARVIAYVFGPNLPRCTAAPKGWLCSREAGHDPPCASYPHRATYTP